MAHGRLGPPAGSATGVRGFLSGSAAGLLADLLPRCRFPDPAGAAPTVLAVSGGADSLALLVLARSAGLESVAVHVDHGLRPGSAAEADVVEAAAVRWGAGYERRAVQVTPGPNLEARARSARYAALGPGVLTGHTADDQAETILLNLLRGAGLDGLSAMARPAPDRAVRPLLGLRRQETRALCAAVGLRPVEDPTNADLALRRNAIRHRVLPLLSEVAERDIVPILVRQSHLLADDAAYLERAAAPLEVTDARALAAAPLSLARRALRAWLRSDDERHPPSAAEVARVLAVARGDVVACELHGGRRVARRANRLRIEPPPSSSS